MYDVFIMSKYNDKKAILSELHWGIHIIWLLNKAVVFVLQDREGGCTVRQMTVNFAELGWGEWIISPDKFDANYCTGSCRFPLTKVKQLISVVSWLPSRQPLTSPPLHTFTCRVGGDNHGSGEPNNQR